MSKSREVKTAESYCKRAAEILRIGKEQDWGFDYLDNAFKCYEQALELDPNYGRAFSGMGYIYSEKFKYELAVENYLIAISKNNLTQKELEGVWFNCGASYCDLARKNQKNVTLMQEYLKKEYDCYTQAILLNPTYQEAYLARGGAGVAKGSLKDAICDLSKAIDMEEKGVEETTELKNEASEKLILILKPCSKDKILEAIQGIEDRDTKILLLKKCLNKNDPELGAKFFKRSTVVPCRLGVSHLADVEKYFRSIDPEAATAYLKEIAPRYTSKMVEQEARAVLGMFAPKPKIPHPQRDLGSDGLELLPKSDTPRRESK